MDKKIIISQQQVAFLILILSLVTRLGGNILIPSIPQITEEFHINKSQATLNLNLFSITLALSFIFLGPICDRKNKRVLLLIGNVISIVSFLLCATAINIYMLDVARFLFAVSGGLIILTAQTWIGDRSGKNELLDRIAWFTLIVALAPMIAPLIGGFITDTLGWRWNFWMMVILTLPFTFIIFKIKKAKTSIHEKEAKYSLSILFKNYKDIILNTPFLKINFVTFGLFMLQGAFLTFSSYLFMDEMGLSATQFGMLSMLFVSGLLLGRFPTMYINKHYSIHTAFIVNASIILASFLGSLSWFIFSGNHSMVEIMFFMTLLQVGFGGLSIIGIRNCMLLEPNRKGSITGIYSFSNNFFAWIGILFTQLFFYYKIPTISIYNIFLVISMMFVIGGTALFLFVYPKVKAVLDN